MHLFLNGLAASAGGGLTYLRNVIPNLSERDGIQVTVALSAELRSEFASLPNVTCISLKKPNGALRFWSEQSQIDKLVKQSGADVLVSAGNFALRKSSVPQILLSRNSLYTSPDFFSDLRSRREYYLLLDTHAKGFLAKRSVAWAGRTVTPTVAFANELRKWTGREVSCIPHGFNPDRFFQNRDPLPAGVQNKLDEGSNHLRLLFVSHYNYYRNFETLFRALPLITKTVGPVKLFLTCELQSNKNPGSYDARSAAALVRELGIRDNVVELGSVPYQNLHRLYSSCDLYVSAAYAETFAHPLVEAMASGLPVIASDIEVHREVCGDAALYFGRFSPQELASQIAALASSREVRERLKLRGVARSKSFSWDTHLDQLHALAQSLIETKKKAVPEGAAFGTPGGGTS